MSSRCLYCACALILLFADRGQAEGFEIEVTIFHGDPKGSREAGTMRRIAAPRMITKTGEEGCVAVGGQILLGKQTVPVGQCVSVIAKDLGEGAIQVKLVFENSKVMGPAAARQVKNAKDETSTTIQSGGRIRLELGDDPKDKTWVEITVGKAK